MVYPVPAPGTSDRWVGASVRTAAQSEARLGGWAIGAVWLYTVVQVASTAATVATLPALVRYVRRVFNGLGTMAAPPPQPPALFHATGSFQLPLVVVSGAVFLVWQYRAATTARALGYPARRSPALGAWSWVIPVLNLWAPYQAVRDLLPPGHAVRALVLRTWLCYVFTILALVVAYLAAFSSGRAGQVIGCVAIVGWVLVGTGAGRVAKAVAADHAAAASRY
jgi:hypothetical protein